MLLQWFALLSMLHHVVQHVSCMLEEARKSIILDTDIYSDVDDVGALALANVMHNCEIVELLGVATSTHSKYGALAIDAINNYYGNGAVPIGALRPFTNETFHDGRSFTRGEFASKVAYHFPGSLASAEQTSDPLEMYRNTLAAAADQSITLVVVGFLTNIAELMSSRPDAISDLDGMSLISSKVTELVIMGGRYPSGLEWNFAGQNPASTKFVVDHWPSQIPMTFLGYEMGKLITTGDGLRKHAPPNSPVLAAYEWYGGRCSTAAASYDPLAMLYAIMGVNKHPGFLAESPFAFANDDGFNEIASDGSNSWVHDGKTSNQHYLIFKSEAHRKIAKDIIDSVLYQDGNDVNCELLRSIQQHYNKSEL